MDPAETHRALTNQQHMARLASSGSPSPPAVGPRDSYACDPELFNGDLDKCRGFLLQCRLVFSQRLLWYASDEEKINYIIGLLRGRALVWAQASSSGMNLSSLSYDEFVARFKSIFDRPNHLGCTSDHLFTLHQSMRLVAEYVVEFGTLAVESG